MKILCVIPGPPTGNSQIFSRRQAAALKEAGIQIETFHIKTWKSFPTLISEYLKLLRAANRTKPDIIHAQYGTMTAALCALCNVKKLVITFGGSDLNPITGNVFRKLFGLLLSQVAALKATKIVCVSDYLRKRLWWKRNRVVVIPSGVGLRLFQPMDRIESRNYLGWDLSERLVLFNVGNDPLLKGEELAEAAVSVARDLTGPIRLVKLYGDVEPDLMPLYYNAADCLLVASVSEGSPNVVKEAMACNLPVVSTCVGDVEERLRKVYPSFVVDRDPFKLGTAVARVLKSNLRSNGRERVIEVSQEVTTKQLIQVYSSM
jgi:teichuronic acid biosynthesis glycosyltransferase TuaC